MTPLGDLSTVSYHVATVKFSIVPGPGESGFPVSRRSSLKYFIPSAYIILRGRIEFSTNEPRNRTLPDYATLLYDTDFAELCPGVRVVTLSALSSLSDTFI